MMEINGRHFVTRELEYETIEEFERAWYNLGMLVCKLVRDGVLPPESLVTAEQCVAYLDYDGDYVVRP